MNENYCCESEDEETFKNYVLLEELWIEKSRIFYLVILKRYFNVQVSILWVLKKLSRCR